MSKIELPVPFANILYTIEKLALTEFLTESDDDTPVENWSTSVVLIDAELFDISLGTTLVPPFIIL